MGNGWTSIDTIVVVAYMAATVTLGLWFTRGQKSLDDYFTAGRAAPWWAVGISIIATDLSAVSYMGCPSYAFKTDLQMGLGIIFFPIWMLLIIYLFVPFLAQVKMFTVYEYLGNRFSMPVRLLASGQFLLLRIGWLATAMYAQGIVLQVMLGLPLSVSIAIIGTLTAIYTIFGGMEAVIWTDVMQFFVLVGGIFVMLGAVLIYFHGDIGQMWSIAAQKGHTRMLNLNLELAPKTGVTIWALILYQMVVNLSSYGSDQLNVQRYLSAGSKKNMAKAIMTNGLLVVPVILMLWLLGIGFFSYYQMHPQLASSLDNADRVLPHFVLRVLPPGLTGLVIAGIFAATMSSLSAGFNSVSTAAIVDFYQPALRKFRRLLHPDEESNATPGLWAARICTLICSIIAIVGGMYVGRLGVLVEIFGKISSFLAGPLLAMFLLAVLTRRTNSWGVAFGVVAGLTTTWLLSSHIFWMLYSIVGCLTTMIVGYIISLLTPSREMSTIKHLTLWGLKKESPVIEAEEPEMV